MSPSETLNPANSMIASLGTGMQALSSVISRKTPTVPTESMKSVAASTIGSVIDAAGRVWMRLSGSMRGRTPYRRALRLPPRLAWMSRLNDPVYRRRALEFGADALLCALAFALAFQLRFLGDVGDQGGIPERYVTMLLGSVAFVALGKALVLDLLGQHQQWWRYFRLPDLWPLVRALAVATGLMVLVFLLAKPYDYSLPRSVVIFDFLLCTVFLGGARLARRSLAERPSRRSRARSREREVLVVGAGSGGQMVVRELQLNPNLGARAIGFIDDDPRKRGMRTEGLRVLGTTDEIGAVLDRLSPDEVVIAIPSAPGVLRGKVVAECRERDITVRTLPTVFELLRGGVQLTSQLREVRVEDVLGRDPVVMELDRVGAYLEDKRVLVTGAGGSIGSELVRQIARVRPRLLVLARPRRGQPVRRSTARWRRSGISPASNPCSATARRASGCSR